MHTREIERALVKPARLWRPVEILARPLPVPRSAGAYAWFFKNVPAVVPVSGCVTSAGFGLLYLGIAPSRSSSMSHLRKRLRGHLRGNASGSTLRLSVGCVLASLLQIQLRRVGPSERLTFGAGEQVLSAWLDENARVAWIVVDSPWQYERTLVTRVSLPLNLDFNKAHSFHGELSRLRARAREVARSLPVVPR
jgi:hypothetical protein